MAITELLCDEKIKYFFTSKYGIIHSTPLSSDSSPGFNMYNFTSPAAACVLVLHPQLAPPCRDKSVLLPAAVICS